MENSSSKPEFDSVGDIGDLIFNSSYDSSCEAEDALFNGVASDDQFFFANQDGDELLPNDSVCKGIGYVPNSSRPLKRESTMDSSDLEMASACRDICDSSPTVSGSDITSLVDSNLNSSSEGEASPSSDYMLGRKFVIQRGRNHKRRMSETCIQTSVPMEGFIKSSYSGMRQYSENGSLCDLWGSNDTRFDEVGGFLSTPRVGSSGPIHVSRSLNDIQELISTELPGFETTLDAVNVFEYDLTKSLQHLDARKSSENTATNSPPSMEGLKSFNAGNSWLPSAPTLLLTGSHGSMHDVTIPEDDNAESFLDALGTGGHEDDTHAARNSPIDASLFRKEQDIHELLDNISAYPLSSELDPRDRADRSKAATLLEGFPIFPEPPSGEIENNSLKVPGMGNQIPLKGSVCSSSYSNTQTFQQYPLSRPFHDDADQLLHIPMSSFFQPPMNPSNKEYLVGHSRSRSSPPPLGSTPPTSPTKGSDLESHYANSNLLNVLRGNNLHPSSNPYLSQPAQMHMSSQHVLHSQPHAFMMPNPPHHPPPSSFLIPRTPSPSPPTHTSTPTNLSVSSHVYQYQHLKQMVQPSAMLAPNATEKPKAKRNPGGRSKSSTPAQTRQQQTKASAAAVLNTPPAQKGRSATQLPTHMGSLPFPSGTYTAPLPTCDMFSSPKVLQSKLPAASSSSSLRRQTETPLTAKKGSKMPQSHQRSASMSSTPRATVGIEELIKQNNSLKAQVAAAKAVREREEAESGQMLETLNRLMGLGGFGSRPSTQAGN
ncbi:hypothetical protein HDU97_009830 [Phlyctochytrium planicorne]|nr:hypothetical protein HDU97_009830 [Phlyctochytrium planicorne]